MEPTTTQTPKPPFFTRHAMRNIAGGPWLILIITNLASLLVGLTIIQFINNTGVTYTPRVTIQTTPIPTPIPAHQTEKLYQGQYFIVSLPSNYRILSEPSGNEAIWEEASFDTGIGRFSIFVSRTEPIDILDSQDGEISSPQIVDGVQATIKKGFGGIAKSVYSWHAVFAKNQKTYHIQLYTLDQDKISQLETEFNRILSTFKFTDFPLIQLGQPTPRAGCYWLQIQCIMAPCNPTLICPTP